MEHASPKWLAFGGYLFFTAGDFPERVGFGVSRRHRALDLWRSMIFSENRYPLFRIMLNCREQRKGNGQTRRRVRRT
jgi:hypothetical protein